MALLVGTLAVASPEPKTLKSHGDLGDTRICLGVKPARMFRFLCDFGAEEEYTAITNATTMIMITLFIIVRTLSKTYIPATITMYLY